MSLYNPQAHLAEIALLLRWFPWLSSGTEFPMHAEVSSMPQQWPATDIARMILDGFDDYREHFRRITDGARERFEQARWQETQTASAARTLTCWPTMVRNKVA